MKIAALLLIICIGISSCSKLDNSKTAQTHPESAATKKLPRAYFVPESAVVILNDSGNYVTMKYGLIGQKYYLITPQDTFSYKYWYEYSVPSWLDTIHVPIHNTRKIYREEEVGQVVRDNYELDSISYYLLNCLKDSTGSISVCELIPTQLDTDMAREYIVEYKADGMTNRHFIFDDSAHFFKFHGVQNVGNRYDSHPIDTSLHGYFGLLEESLWGTGVHEFSYVYYRLTNDSVAFAFSLVHGHSEYCYTLFGIDYDPTINIVASPFLLDDGNVKVRYEMYFELHLADDTHELFSHATVFEKVISRIDAKTSNVHLPSGEFEPPPSGTDVVDSMFVELSKLKINGTTRQQYYLRNMNY